LRIDMNVDIPSKTELYAQIEDLKRANTVLSHSIALINQRNQELDQFVGIVAHDLKAPLRAVTNLSQWLEDDLMNQIPPENKEQLQLMRSRIFRMNALIEGLSQYARVGREDIKPEMVCVRTLLEEAIDSIAPPPEFTIEIDQMPTIFTKRIMLNQVFTNLISNAIKHHYRPDGHIHISSKKIIVNDYQQNPVEFYEFAIADDGSGIDVNRQTRIFNIFQTSEVREKTQSSGIGLTIVKKIVETEGGQIRLDSQVGLGSTFYFTWYKS
jgi:signal transduction histidine kinase